LSFLTWSSDSKARILSLALAVKEPAYFRRPGDAHGGRWEGFRDCAPHILSQSRRQGIQPFPLRELKQPVILIKASHNKAMAETANTKEGGSVHKEMPVSINCRVMLRENQWVERRLFNGSMGTLRDIVWDAGADPDKDPHALLMDFDDHDNENPCATRDPENGGHLIPVFRVKRNWVRGAAPCTREQFPLTVAYAITIHKSQGISVDKAILNPGKKRDFQPGLTDIAVTRVRTLRGILFKEPFDFKRLKASTTETTVMRATDQAKRLKQRPAYPPGGHSNIRSTSSSSEAPHHISSRHMRPGHSRLVRHVPAPICWAREAIITSAYREPRCANVPAPTSEAGKHQASVCE